MTQLNVKNSSCIVFTLHRMFKKSANLKQKHKQVSTLGVVTDTQIHVAIRNATCDVLTPLLTVQCPDL